MGQDVLEDSESNLPYFVGLSYDFYLYFLSFVDRPFLLYCHSMLDVVLIRHHICRSKSLDKDPQVHFSVSGTAHQTIGLLS